MFSEIVHNVSGAFEPMVLIRFFEFKMDLISTTRKGDSAIMRLTELTRLVLCAMNIECSCDITINLSPETLMKQYLSFSLLIKLVD